MFITDSRAYWNGFILLVAFCGVTWRFKQEVHGPRHFPKHHSNMEHHYFTTLVQILKEELTIVSLPPF